MQSSSYYAIAALVILALALVVAACGGLRPSTKTTLECDAASAAQLAPFVRVAVEQRDYARLAALLVEFGADAYACAHKELAKSTDAGVPAKDGSP